MTGPLFWLARLAVLTLSLLATLSILGAIASIGSADMAGRPVGNYRAGAADPRDVGRAQRTSPAPPAEQARGEPGATRTAAQPGAAAPPPPPDPLRWLEPLTYAMLALAVLAAVGVLLLWRIAVRLEDRS